MKGIEFASFQAVVRLILEIECHGLQGICAEYLATAHHQSKMSIAIG